MAASAQLSLSSSDVALDTDIVSGDRKLHDASGKPDASIVSGDRKLHDASGKPDARVVATRTDTAEHHDEKKLLADISGPVAEAKMTSSSRWRLVPSPQGDGNDYWYFPPEYIGKCGLPAGQKFPTDEVEERISASRLAAILGKSNYPDRTPEQTIDDILLKTVRSVGQSAQLGHDFQPLITKWYSEHGPKIYDNTGKLLINKISPIGMAVPKKYPYLGAIADGAIRDETTGEIVELVEIKTRYKLTPGLRKEIVELPNEDYYEMLEQLFCYNCEFVRYIVYSRETDEVFHCRIPFDEKHWYEFVMPNLALVRERMAARKLELAGMKAEKNKDV
jgi:hypothetical protein